MIYITNITFTIVACSTCTNLSVTKIPPFETCHGQDTVFAPFFVGIVFCFTFNTKLDYFGICSAPINQHYNGAHHLDVMSMYIHTLLKGL